MREALFIKKNKDRWEEIRQQEDVSVDELSSNFTQAVEDLSYARTFYSRSGITRYLNNMAARFYLNIYKNKKEDVSRFALFFKQELPMSLYRLRWHMLLSLLGMVLFTAVGVYSSIHDDSFVRQVLGNSYVSMTERNISEGHPFAVYAGGNSLIMWLSIFINNIYVSFRFFGEGILFGVFTIKDLFETGLMLGSFEYIFFSHGLGLKSILTIMVHGTLELSSITVAGGAGLALGMGFLFPGTYKRLHSLREAAKDGVKVMVGLVPVFLIAAFFEGFVTRYSDMPWYISIIILAGSASYVIFYFGVYPIMVAKKLAQKQEEQA